MAVIDREYQPAVDACGPSATLAPVVLRRSFEPASESVGEARRFVKEALGEDRDDRDLVALLVSELSTNAVKHARTSFDVEISVQEQCVRVEVSDGSPFVALLPGTSLQSNQGGRGLLLVDRLAAQWGCRPSAAGKTVWFESRQGQGEHS